MKNSLKKNLSTTLKATSILALTLTSLPSFAADVLTLGSSASSLTSQMANFGNLMTVLLMVFGLFCLHKIVQTVINREDERSYPLKNIPLYFLGAAIGLGASLSSELVQGTIFGKKSTKVSDDVFTVGGGSGGE